MDGSSGSRSRSRDNVFICYKNLGTSTPDQVLFWIAKQKCMNTIVCFQNCTIAWKDVYREGAISNSGIFMPIFTIRYSNYARLSGVTITKVNVNGVEGGTDQ